MNFYSNNDCNKMTIMISVLVTNATINGDRNKYTISNVLYNYHHRNCGYSDGNIYSLAKEYSNISSKYSGIIAWIGKASEHNGGANVFDTMIDNFCCVYLSGNILLLNNATLCGTKLVIISNILALLSNEIDGCDSKL